MQAFATVDEYIAAQSAAAQPRLRELRAIIRAALPEATEVISYGMPTYKFRDGTVHFGAAKRHCALYGTPMDLFADDLRGYDTSKGTVRFPLDQPIPEELVRKLVIAKAARTGALMAEHSGAPAQLRRNKVRTVLIVDDEPRILDSVRMNLELEGYQVFEATNGQEALDEVRRRLPDLVVMDVMMPELDGFEALHELRKFSAVPVVLLTVKADERDVIHGLELGADDYIAKPFSPGVLLSRIKAVLRRAETPPQAPASRVLHVDDRLVIDFDRHEVWKDGEKVQLRPTEFRLLYHLASNPGVVMTHETLLSRVWGPEYRDASHYVRLYINYLRQKLEDDPANPHYILTERGVGYRFADPVPGNS